MKFFRITESTDLKVVGKFPQRMGDYYSGVTSNEIEGKVLYEEVQMFTEISEKVFVPKLELKHGSKLTDVISFSINFDFFISEKLKSIFEKYNQNNFQYIPTVLKKKEKVFKYFFMRGMGSYNINNCCHIDFSRTEILMFKSTWDVDYSFKVKSEIEFFEIIEKTKLPYHVAIKWPKLKDNIPEHLFALEHVYHGYQVFISEELKLILEKEKITGIRYLELDEVQ
jgi:hypothetical protein